MLPDPALGFARFTNGKAHGAVISPRNQGSPVVKLECLIDRAAPKPGRLLPAVDIGEAV